MKIIMLKKLWQNKENKSKTTKKGKKICLVGFESQTINV